MRDLDGADRGRELVGLEHRMKSTDAIKARVAEDMWLKGRTVNDAMANLTDAIRYTFAYPLGGYAAGVPADLRRLTAAGFAEVKLRNAWSWPRFRGITSCWREQSSGQTFEVQFHSRESFEAVGLTTPAYERLRNTRTSDAERAALVAFIERVFAAVPTPPGAAAVADVGIHPQLPGPSSRPVDAAGGITYFAVIDSFSSRDSPAGVMRRVFGEGGQRDEAFGRDLAWGPTTLLYSAERGNLDNELDEISADEAGRIVDAVRREAANNE